MPQSPSQVRVINPILSHHALGYRHQGHVGHYLFPHVPVGVSGGQVLQFGKESFMLYKTQRAPGANSRRISFGYLGAAYALENHSIEVPLPREHIRDAAAVPGINLGMRATDMGMKTIALPLEKQCADIAVNASNYAAANKIALTSTAKWSDHTNGVSDPNGNIDDGKEAIRQKIGEEPNVAIVSPAAFNAVKRHPQMLDQIKHTGRDNININILRDIWEIEHVVIGKAMYAQDDGTFVDVWGNNVVLAYAPQTPAGMEEPSFGYTYNMEGHPMVEEPYYDKSAKSWIYGVEHERAPVLTGMEAGYLIQTPA